MSTIESVLQAGSKKGPLKSLSLASGQAPPASPFVEGFEQWVKDFDRYESMLGDVAKISLNPKYKEELGTVESWFKETTITERTATMYHLLQISTQEQLRFLVCVIQRVYRPESIQSPPVSGQFSAKPRLGKLNARPPTLNLPDLGSPSPVTPTPLTALKESAAGERNHPNNASDPSTWTNSTNAGNTPLLPIFEKPEAAPNSAAPVPGPGSMNPYTLNMLANAGLSAEAQLLAVQLIMSGLVQPTGAAAAKPAKKLPTASWRGTGATPTSARFGAAAPLRTSGLRTSALKSAGLGALGSIKSAGLDSPALDSPKPEDFEPEMLQDIPAWMRGLRLHKYTSAFDGLTWQEVIVLDDAALEARGVAALGARRRLLRTFEVARKRMGMEDDSTTPTSTVAPTLSKLPTASERIAVPHSAVPINRSKLSISSPEFKPTLSPSVPSAEVTSEATFLPAAEETKA